MWTEAVTAYSVVVQEASDKDTDKPPHSVGHVVKAKVCSYLVLMSRDTHGIYVSSEVLNIARMEQELISFRLPLGRTEYRFDATQESQKVTPSYSHSIRATA